MVVWRRARLARPSPERTPPIAVSGVARRVWVSDPSCASLGRAHSRVELGPCRPLEYRECSLIPLARDRPPSALPVSGVPHRAGSSAKPRAPFRLIALPISEWLAPGRLPMPSLKRLFVRDPLPMSGVAHGAGASVDAGGVSNACLSATHSRYRSRSVTSQDFVGIVDPGVI
jgi:hypothetical protein